MLFKRIQIQSQVSSQQPTLIWQIFLKHIFRLFSLSFPVSEESTYFPRKLNVIWIAFGIFRRPFISMGASYQIFWQVFLLYSSQEEIEFQTYELSFRQTHKVSKSQNSDHLFDCLIQTDRPIFSFSFLYVNTRVAKCVK